ncbi:hypothetical protein QFZ63_002727 [Streptomyces sp. B3I7]|uniref:hypothetical protein n=1 Tax=Streptomyces sp. B3I7 TaxID=3042269 RepID=UPI002788E013|nr:hypothetical protein [Streptomyces sp. B3I7]MDQ0811013.1 hypothetical protein [Streptomyces sp. B3I7]
MSGRSPSDAGGRDAAHADPSDALGTADVHAFAEDAVNDEDAVADEDAEDGFSPDARRARWIATGTGALLTAAGLAAAVLRAVDAAPPLVPLAYASGAAGCALAAVLGSRGRTRRALWLMIAGTALMAVGDQFD